MLAGGSDKRLLIKRPFGLCDGIYKDGTAVGVHMRHYILVLDSTNLPVR